MSYTGPWDYPTNNLPHQLVKRTDALCLRKQRLRYKDYRLMNSEAVERGRLFVQAGNVKEFESIKALTPDLNEAEVLDWWNLHTGFVKGEG